MAFGSLTLRGGISRPGCPTGDDRHPLWPAATRTGVDGESEIESACPIGMLQPGNTRKAVAKLEATSWKSTHFILFGNS